jgi:hypothetical protein
MTDFQLLDGILLGPPGFNVYLQPVSCEVAVRSRPDISDHADIIQPLEPIIYFFQRLLFLAAGTQYKNKK